MAKYKGEFWLSGEEDKKFIGEIKLGRRSSELSLTIPSTDKLDTGRFLQSDPLRPVIGVTTCGKVITLTNYFQVWFPHSFTRPRHAKFCVNEAFVGPHNEIAECDPVVETATITSEPLVEWCGVSSHECDPASPWAVRYSPPDHKEIYRDADFTIELGFGASTSLCTSGASITDSARIVLKAERPLAWSRVFTTLCNTLEAVSIGCGAYCKISQATASFKDPEYRADYHFHPLFPDSKVECSSWWLFTFHDLLCEVAAFTKWMKKADELKRARALFFSAQHHKMFTESRILLLVQAAEAYCRVVHGEDPGGKRGYLTKHLHMLRKEYKDPISVVFPNASTLVTNVVNFRKDQIHSLQMSSSTKPGNEQLRMEHFLRLLLETCFMSQLGISIADMTQLVERSPLYSQLSVLTLK